jgi:hypothetical protein
VPVHSGHGDLRGKGLEFAAEDLRAAGLRPAPGPPPSQHQPRGISPVLRRVAVVFFQQQSITRVSLCHGTHRSSEPASVTDTARASGGLESTWAMVSHTMLFVSPGARAG